MLQSLNRSKTHKTNAKEKSGLVCVIATFFSCNVSLLHLFYVFLFLHHFCARVLWPFECVSSFPVHLCLSATVAVGTGKSTGAFGDDQQPAQTANLWKTILWLIGQGPLCVNRIFLRIWVLNHRPKSYPVVCLSVISITSIQGVLISFRGEKDWQRVNRDEAREARYLWVWKGGVCGNKYMLKMWLLDTVVMYHVWWSSWDQADDLAHGDESSQGWEVL